MIPVGTICFLSRGRCLTIPPTKGVRHFEELYRGRIVEVVGPLMMHPDAGFSAYRIDADWLRRDHPRNAGFFAAPGTLIPIAGPDKSSPVPPKRKPVCV